jgi:hypothetical protein
MLGGVGTLLKRQCSQHGSNRCSQHHGTAFHAGVPTPIAAAPAHTSPPTLRPGLLRHRGLTSAGSHECHWKYHVIPPSLSRQSLRDNIRRLPAPEVVNVTHTLPLLTTLAPDPWPGRIMQSSTSAPVREHKLLEAQNVPRQSCVFFSFNPRGIHSFSVSDWRDLTLSRGVTTYRMRLPCLMKT